MIPVRIEEDKDWLYFSFNRLLDVVIADGASEG